MKHVACGIMTDKDGNILMGQRHSRGTDPGVWEFPGGKQEKDETIEQCLHREWMEELNLRIEIFSHFITTKQDDYVCHFFTGIILNIEDVEMNVHEKLGLYNLREISKLRLYEIDKKMVDLMILRQTQNVPLLNARTPIKIKDYTY
jgi:8-oxo-dGTP diphosphatase